MLNSVMLVGRVEEITRQGKTLKIEVEGHSFIVDIPGDLASRMTAVVIRSLIGVKGKLSKNGGRTIIIADRISFLAGLDTDEPDEE